MIWKKNVDVNDNPFWCCLLPSAFFLIVAPIAFLINEQGTTFTQKLADLLLFLMTAIFFFGFYWSAVEDKPLAFSWLFYRSSLQLLVSTMAISSLWSQLWYWDWYFSWSVYSLFASSGRNRENLMNSFLFRNWDYHCKKIWGTCRVWKRILSVHNAGLSTTDLLL